VIVLDTHAWVWWVSGSPELSSKAKESIEVAVTRNEVFVSAISVWEVAMLVKKGRLELTMPIMDWVSRSEALPYIRFVPVDNAVALRSVNLERFAHPDPADRMILATASFLEAAIVTKDRRMRAYRGVRTIW
jgi:PIN domain nuclease of toxin-antitoxin system